MVILCSKSDLTLNVCRVGRCPDGGISGIPILKCLPHPTLDHIHCQHHQTTLVVLCQALAKPACTYSITLGITRSNNSKSWVNQGLVTLKPRILTLIPFLYYLYRLERPRLLSPYPSSLPRAPSAAFYILCLIFAVVFACCAFPFCFPLANSHLSFKILFLIFPWTFQSPLCSSDLFISPSYHNIHCCSWS